MQLNISQNASANCIVINAGTGSSEIDASQNNAFYVNPIRPQSQMHALYYNSTTKEITYDVSGGQLPAGTTGVKSQYLSWDGSEWVANTDNYVAIGYNAGSISQEDLAIAIGFQAGQKQGQSAIAIGQNAGKSNQNEYSVAIGRNAGEFNQFSNTIAIGNLAGNTDQSGNAIAIGFGSGQTRQLPYFNCYRKVKLEIQINPEMQLLLEFKLDKLINQEIQLLLGVQAGQTDQSGNSIAIGYRAGKLDQSGNSIAIGYRAGTRRQSGNAIAIGNQAGEEKQSENSVAIGAQAGEENQGQYSIAIGAQAGKVNQAGQSIVLNATGQQQDVSNTGSIILNADNGFIISDDTASLYVKPLAREIGPQVLYYDESKGKITYERPLALAGTITTANVSTTDTQIGSFESNTSNTSDTLDFYARFNSNTLTITVTNNGTAGSITLDIYPFKILGLNGASTALSNTSSSITITRGNNQPFINPTITTTSSPPSNTNFIASYFIKITTAGISTDKYHIISIIYDHGSSSKIYFKSIPVTPPTDLNELEFYKAGLAVGGLSV